LLLERRIEACENQINAAPAYSKRYVDIQYGKGVAPNCQPAAMVTRPQELIYLYDQLERCVAYENLLAAVPAPPLLFHSIRPTMYILINSLPPAATQPATGGGTTAGASSGKGTSSGATSAQSSSGGQSSNAGASGGTSQTSGGGGIDNPGTLLLYDLAMRLEPGDETEPAPPNRVFFIPAPQWTLSSFYNQCLSDPPDGTGGTLGAIVVDESTTSNGGQFGLFFVNGWAYVKYSAQLLMCDPPSPLNTTTAFPIELTWHGYGEGKDYRNAISFLPIATWLTYISTKWIPSSTFTSGTTNFSINPSEPWNYALQPFLTASAQITLGDTGATMTVPRAYDNASVDLLSNLNRYCASFGAGRTDLNRASQVLCAAISDACARRQQVPARARDFAIIEPCGLRYERPVLFIPH
jgi:hypothetical protein